MQQECQKPKKKVCHWNDKFKEFSTLQIATAVYTSVAEYHFLCKELLLNKKKKNFKRQQKHQENSQSVLLASAASLYNSHNQQLSFHSV
jgi:hypothetical protein